MPTYVRSGEAARILGVRPATLYAYVSRGLLPRRTAVDGRTSLYALDDVEALAARGRRRDVAPRPSIDVRITSRITQLHDDRLEVRGRDLTELVADHGFEDIAELLWTGTLPSATRWPAPDPADVRAARSVSAPQGAALDPLGRLIVAATTLGARHPGLAPTDAARRLIPVVARLGVGDYDVDLDVRHHATVAAACVTAWTGASEPDPALVRIVDLTLALLADHELATSTLAVRIAGSTRADPWSAFVAGLATLRGPLHGTAVAQVAELLDECRQTSPARAVDRRRAAGERIPGFGHSIYRGDDPRVAPLLTELRALEDHHGEIARLDQLLDIAAVRLTHRPNIDLALGALLRTAGLPGNAPVFAIARIAGWAAHLDEELDERPLRFRGVSHAST